MFFSFISKILLSFSRFILNFFLKFFNKINYFLARMNFLITKIFRNYNSHSDSFEETSRSEKFQSKIFKNFFVLKNLMNQKNLLNSFIKTKNLSKNKEFNKNLFFEKCFLCSDGKIFQDFIENFQKYMMKSGSNHDQSLKEILEFDMFYILENIKEKLEIIHFSEKDSEFSEIIEFEILIQLNLILLASLYFIFEEIMNFVKEPSFEMNDLQDVLEFNFENSFILDNFQII
jgi:hypothetical protein